MDRALLRGVAALGLVGGCATTPLSAPVQHNTEVSLRPGLPPQSAPDPRCGTSPCAESGAPVRVVLAGRSAQASELYERYLRAVYAHSAEALRPLLADAVFPSDQSTNTLAIFARESVIAAHERLFQGIDVAQRPFAAVFVTPTVRPLIASGGSALRIRDVLVQGDTTAFRRSVNQSLPTPVGMPARCTLVVRWIDDEPRIVGVPASVLALRP